MPSFTPFDRCLYCGNEIDPKTEDSTKYHRACIERIDKINEAIDQSPHSPALLGLSDGPGSGVNETHFNKPKPYLEALKTVRTLEEHGKLKTPKQINQAKVFLEDAKKQGDGKIDYLVDGHPHFDRN